MSDGHHILFIDPLRIDRLVLGCDAPLGGATKLIRKVVFIPPEDKAVPRLYTAAADLSQGARIVVTYGDTIVLYSVPPDVIALSQREQKAETRVVDIQPPVSIEGRSQNHWLNWWDEPRDHNTIWPLAIRGTTIGRLKGICELAAQTRPDIIIWAFTHASHCKTWRLRNFVDPVIRTQQYVCRDRIVHDLYSVDDTGDVIMRDAPAPDGIDLHVQGEHDERPSAERSIMLGFDGNASGVLKRIPKALAVENDDWVDLVDVRGCSDAWYEGDGDVVMFYGT